MKDSSIENSLLCFFNNWNKFVQVRVSLFVYKLLNNKLSTKDNLAPHGALYWNTNFCVSVCISRTSMLYISKGSIAKSSQRGNKPITIHCWAENTGGMAENMESTNKYAKKAS